jgi:hypothetical protein
MKASFNCMKEASFTRFYYCVLDGGLCCVVTQYFIHHTVAIAQVVTMA